MSIAPRGSYQLVVREIEPKGIGALELALRKLKERLAAEGLFDPARKRPRLPQGYDSSARESRRRTATMPPACRAEPHVRF
ncbi:MAG TPA: hypothetical protein PK867_10195 [Pirellulales bacterium]|nr:hypothetical protein [Pirellulales bacterium]